jgi:hypothetical protein
VTQGHERKCYECGAVAEHFDNVAPEVCCKTCGSQNTNRVSKPPVRLTRQQVCTALSEISQLALAACQEIESKVERGGVDKYLKIVKLASSLGPTLEFSSAPKSAR